MQELIQFSTLPCSIIIIMSKSIQISYLKVSYSEKMDHNYISCYQVGPYEITNTQFLLIVKTDYSDPVQIELCLFSLPVKELKGQEKKSCV